jgi:hypothetical protein
MKITCGRPLRIPNSGANQIAQLRQTTFKYERSESKTTTPRHGHVLVSVNLLKNSAGSWLFVSRANTSSFLFLQTTAMPVTHSSRNAHVTSLRVSNSTLSLLNDPCVSWPAFNSFSEEAIFSCLIWVNVSR